MGKILNVNDRGTLTLPRDLRSRLGLKTSGQILAEETPDGILLRAGTLFPLEIYTAERIAEFEKSDAELASFSSPPFRKAKPMPKK